MRKLSAKYHKGVNVLERDNDGNPISSLYCEEETWGFFFTPAEIYGFFELAQSEASEKDIEDFCSWLSNSIAAFILSHHEKHDANTTGVEKRKQTRKFYEEIDKHSTALIKLLHNSNKEFWDESHEGQRLLDSNDLPNSGSGLENSFCFKELNKHFSKRDSAALSIGYITEEISEFYDLITQLIALKMTALTLKGELPSGKKGRNRTLDALNAFATGFAIKYRQCFKKPFTLLRHKNDNGKYDPVTPCHRIFSRIINKIQFCMEEQPVTDANIVNALEYAQAQLNKVNATPINSD